MVPPEMRIELRNLGKSRQKTREENETFIMRYRRRRKGEGSYIR